MDVPFALSYGIAAIFVIMLVKETGVPVPIPSDLLMIAAGIQIAAAAYPLPALVGALALAVLIGGSIQFLLARSVGRAIVYRIASAVGVPAERMDRSVERLRSGGARAVFIGLNIPQPGRRSSQPRDWRACVSFRSRSRLCWVQSLSTDGTSHSVTW